MKTSSKPKKRPTPPLKKPKATQAGKVEWRRIMVKEGAILSFTEDVLRVIAEKGSNQSDLADRMGTSRAFVSKLMQGENNFTIETMSKVAVALKSRLVIRLETP